MTYALVTGGAGFIGSHVVHGLVARGDRARVLDNFSTGKRQNIADVSNRIEIIEGDLRNPEDCRRACQGVELVFHIGALPSVPKSVQDPLSSHQANVDGTFNLLLAARDAGVRRVVYSASSSAYGDTPTLPKIETMAPSPLSPYAVNKLVGEYYCQAFCHCFGLQTVSLRYFNVFGPRQDPKSQYAAAIPAFVTAILRDQPPTIYGDGEQTRDFTYVDNVVHANLLAAGAPQVSGEVLNIACGERVSVNQIIGAINRLLGKSVKPTYEPPRAGDVKHSLADIGLAKRVIGFEPKIGFERGLELAIDWYRQNL
jgi:nucleoside-diphosphate-sugar epimerase